VTAADFSIGAGMVYAAQAQYPLAGTLEIARWYERLAALPAWRQSLPP